MCMCAFDGLCVCEHLILQWEERERGHMTRKEDAHKIRRKGEVLPIKSRPRHTVFRRGKIVTSSSAFCCCDEMTWNLSIVMVYVKKDEKSRMIVKSLQRYE